MSEETNPTPLEISRANTGRRFYIVDANAYTQLVAAIDVNRGFPNSNTITALAPVEDLVDATDGSGKLFSISTHRVKSSDEPILQERIESGSLQEIEEGAFLSICPPRPAEQFNE